MHLIMVATYAARVDLKILLIRILIKLFQFFFKKYFYNLEIFKTNGKPKRNPPKHSGKGSIDVASIFVAPHPDGTLGVNNTGNTQFFVELAAH